MRKGAVKIKNLSFDLPIEPRTKKNSVRLIHVGERTLPIASKAYQEFENDCLKIIPGAFRKMIAEPVNIRAIFYMRTKRRIDLTNLLEAVDDMLTKAGVLADDSRDIVAGHDGSRVYYDKDNPRIEIEITPEANYAQWKK